MDNRGYAVDWYGAGNPPVVVENRPDYVLVKKRHRAEYSESDSDSSRSRNRYTVESPPDGTVWGWLVVFACAMLHLCSELVYFMFFNTIQIASLRNPRLLLGGETPKNTYMEFMVFENVRFTGEIVAAFASVFIGYRVVAAFGSLCVLGGFLGASFVDPDEMVELMGFLVGFLGGIGVSFWRFAAYVAIMEYFQRHRMTALILSGFGRFVGILVGYGILAKPLSDLMKESTTIDDIKSMTEWPVYFQCQCAMAAVGFLVSLVIKPLPLVKSRRGHECAWFLRIRDSRVCRGGMLILVLSVYFLYYFGESLPLTSLIPYVITRKLFSIDHTLGTMFAAACGVLLGYLLLPFWPLRKRLHGSLLWMGLFCLFMGLITLQLPAFYQISYIASFAVLFSAAQTMFETILRYVIPIAFGRQYIRWIEGLLGLMAGGATIANNYIAKELVKQPGDVDNVFYFAGSAFLAAGLLAVVIIQIAICLKRFPDRNFDYVYPSDEMRKRDLEMSRSHGSKRARDRPAQNHHYSYQYR